MFLHNFEKSQKVKSLLSNLITKDDPYKNKSRFGRIASEDSDEEEDDDESEQKHSVASSVHSNHKEPDVRNNQSEHSSEVFKTVAEDKDANESNYENEEFLPLDGDGDNGLKASKRVVTRDVQYKGNEVIEPIPELEEVVSPPPPQQVHLDEQSLSSQDSDSSWNHMTKLEQSVLPFTSLVCMPPQLRASDVSLYPHTINCFD